MLLEEVPALPVLRPCPKNSKQKTEGLRCMGGRFEAGSAELQRASSLCPSLSKAVLEKATATLWLWTVLLGAEELFVNVCVNSVPIAAALEREERREGGEL